MADVGGMILLEKRALRNGEKKKNNYPELAVGSQQIPSLTGLSLVLTSHTSILIDAFRPEPQGTNIGWNFLPIDLLVLRTLLIHRLTETSVWF